MKKRIALVAVLVVLVATAAWFTTRPTPTVGAITLYGNVDIRQVALAFEGSDRVVEMRVEEGDRIAAGQTLAVLDTRTSLLKLAQAKAQVAVLRQAYLALKNGSRPEEVRRADAQLMATQAEVERQTRVLERLEATSSSSAGRAVSAQDVDNARMQLRVAQAQAQAQSQTKSLATLGPRKEDIARAEAQLQVALAEQALLQHQIELAELKAPQAGIIRSRLLEPGDMASPQRPAYTLAISQPKWVRAYLNEAQLGHVRPGMSASVATDGAVGKTIPGRVGYISSVAEFTPKSVQTEDLRTSLVYEVRILVDDPDDHLRLGMPATVHIAFEPVTTEQKAP